MKKILLLCGLVLLIKCVTEPVPGEPKIVLYANRSVVEYLPLYIYLDSSFAGALVDTVKPFQTETPPMSDQSLLKIDVTPGTHNITVISFPAVKDTFIDRKSPGNILNDIAIQPDFHSSRNTNVEMGQYRFIGVGN
jgi:hypothetical protein